ncbi:VacJ family lipoprotein [Altererythrobacter sp. GH1-8]|uniref:MlaA family lipoprotein n=1 Tax=Altererythrobacter sp. GH1-8 TaxID=3349333 RepID=UPI00374C9EAF
MAIALTSAALIAAATPLPLSANLSLMQQGANGAAVGVGAGVVVGAGVGVGVGVEPATPEPDPVQVLEGEEAAPAPDDNAEVSPEVSPEGSIVVTGSAEVRKKDPLVQVNETAFRVTQKVDSAIVEPIAGVYEDDLPSPIRKGLRNFFRNLLEPITALNYFLQLKPGKGFETLGRFAVNSTVGVGGLFDVAKKEPFNLPYRRNGFANTLGYYGVGPGPFLVLPLVGATTLRDFIGGGVDQSIIPFAVGKPFNTPLYAIPAYTVNSLEFRIKFDEQIEAINTSDDPYFAMRETYLCQREAEIAALKNRPPPRDCSIEAIMGLEPGTIDQLTQPGEDNMAAEVSGSEILAETAAEAEPETPAIVYVSNPVIQPLPTGYVQAPPPSN